MYSMIKNVHLTLRAQIQTLFKDSYILPLRSNHIFTFLIDLPKFSVLDGIRTCIGAVSMHHNIIITSYETVSIAILRKGFSV